MNLHFICLEEAFWVGFSLSFDLFRQMAFAVTFRPSVSVRLLSSSPLVVADGLLCQALDGAGLRFLPGWL